MRARAAWLCLALASVGFDGVAQNRSPDAAAPASAPASPLAEALVARFAACHAAESRPLADTDFTLLRATLGARAVAVAGAVGALDCVGASHEAACVDALRSAACEPLASALATAMREAAPGWAAGYARVLAQRVGVCYAAEADGGAVDDAREVLAAYERETAETLGALARSPGCRVNENFLPACSSAVAAMPCGSLGGRLENEPADQLRALGDACRRLVECAGDAGLTGHGPSR